MRAKTLTIMGGLVALITLTSFGQELGYTATTRASKSEVGLGKMLAQKMEYSSLHANDPIPTASEVLEGILEKIKAGIVPIGIYPLGHLEHLKEMGDQPIYTFKELDSSDYVLKAGDKANMVWLDATFNMGSPTSETGRDSGETQHTVTFTYPFYIGKYEVTQNEYLEIMGSNPSYHTGNLNKPVENISWANATNYCYLLTLQERANGHIPSTCEYRLPTESEWEYSCRAGTTTAFNFGSEIRSGMANFNGQQEYTASGGTVYNGSGVSLGTTTVVGSYDPNEFGLFDMHGNVNEFTWDNLGSIEPSTSQLDPFGSMNSSPYLYRGGSQNFYGVSCRSAFRFFTASPSFVVGFRVILVPTVPEWKTAIEADISRYSLVSIGSIPSGKDSLIIITHGRIPGGDDPAVSIVWVDSMSNSVTSYLTAHSINNWQVRGYKWIDGASTNVFRVLENAKQQGVNLGRQILAQGYTHVHFIAHSAGAGLIQSATDVIKANNSSVVIHETFLDPYVGPLGSGAAVYGNGVNWADNYFTRDDGDTGFGDSLPFTQFIMPNTYNVDVTQLDVNNREQRDYFVTGSGTPCYKTKSKHGWPIDFYMNTITGKTNSDYQGYGFPLSEVGGGFNYAAGNYFTGNGTFGHPVALKQLGTPDPDCFFDIQPPTYPSSVSDFLNSPAVQSTTGTINKYPNGSIKEISGSPAWLATFITVSNVANIVSFEADFQSTNSAAEGLLSIYWDNESIGSIDERVVQGGFQTYTFKFPTATSNSMHMLGFRLDPFTNIQSVVVITNVITTASGVTQPFSITMTGVTNGLQHYQLTGQAGFEYSVQATTNFVNWKTIVSLLNTNGTVQFYDKDSTNYTYRFYRAVAPF